MVAHNPQETASSEKIEKDIAANDMINHRLKACEKLGWSHIHIPLLLHKSTVHSFKSM